MSHEEMLKWLDQANSGTVQAAAEKLKAAAKEIHKIAEDLKIRPQWVTWKGDGADAFRVWSGDLANATVSLGDFSEDSAKWLSHASDAISTAQASIPRDKAGAEANLAAAKSAHNDPDAGAISSKSSSELAALAANTEKVRQEAAGEMRKLAGAYQVSATQMNGLKRPRFPPPPEAIAPVDSSRDVTRPGAGNGEAPASTGAVAATPAQGQPANSVRSRAETPEASASAVSPEHRTPTVIESPTQMGIDSVGTLPETAPPVTSPAPSQPGPSVTGPPNTTPPPLTGPIQPAYGNSRGPLTGRGTGPTARGISSMGNPKGTVKPGGPPVESATGRPSTPGGRGPTMPGQSATSTGRSGAPGRLPTSNGVSGGRPQPVTGQPAKGIPRGKVMGTEGVTNSRSATGQGQTGARPTTMGANGSPRGASSGRRTAGATGDKGGIVGGRPQQQGRANNRSFSPGGSGLVRGQGSAAGASPEESHRTGQAGRAGVTPQGARPEERRDEEQGSRPDYLVEDEETWQPDTRRNVPSVVDGTSENSER
ncbi:translation initiation factor IF-2 [Streptomyces sp. AcE210]|uniref:translation initiation factor IF-2 n=1 Tax=Streptomyces sp. AcE210 TaxID=2292703 RepID=UPI001404AC86|nr:translation initiation factor IF-2 [Streptomyces sp. AcE210]